MRQKSGPEKSPAEQVVKDIRRATRWQFSAEEKIRIVLEGVRGEESSGRGGRHMRNPASEKAEVIRLVEGSHLPARRTLDKLGIPRTTFYRWYDRYLTGGIEALADHRSRPDRVWNRIPDPIRAEIVELDTRKNHPTSGALMGSAHFRQDARPQAA